MDNCEEQEMKNIRPILRKWFDWLFNKNEIEKKLKITRYNLKHNIIFFFYLGFLSRTFTIHRTAGEGGGYLFNSSLPLSPASQTLRY